MMPESLSFNPDQRLSRSHLVILAVLVVLSLGVYLLAATLTFRIGFPLDDSWIHQTYARNLALNGEWAFMPGQPSAGSTAPLWSILLSVGFWIGLSPYIWTYLLGAVLLWSLAVLAERAARGVVPSYRPSFPWVGVVMALEWHLVWAAGSGMETLLQCLLVIAVMILLVESRRFILVGLLIALSVWVRPDGITLLGPAIFTILLAFSGWKLRLRALGNLVLGFMVLFTPYLLFNLVLDGTPWPNTFYAKQAEYAIFREIPLLERYLRLLLQPLIGVGLALIPGMVFAVVLMVRRRQWGALAGIIWFFGYIGLYALRLPVTYQHGRYLIPAMPVFFFWGMIGLLTFLKKPAPRWMWSVDTAIRMLVIALLLLFWAMGASAYGQDVAVIESEMVTVASWVSDHLPEDALVAAHDIGALGFFGNHELVDMAGLVSPDVIPFIRDEARLREYLDKSGVNYLVTFPDWYPELTKDLEPVFVSNGVFAPAFDEMNMAVYRWSLP